MPAGAEAPVTGRLGTCPVCIGLCAACLALGLLVAALGGSLDLFALRAAGLAGAAIFGPLLLLHALFYLLRRGERPAAPPMLPKLRPGPVRPAPRGCCGRWS
jgi:hypothetical protein